MPVGRYFRALTAYDLLGNLVPGVIMTIAVLGFLPSPPIPSTVGGYALFSVVAFTVGSVLQAHASEAVGARNSFKKTITGAESLPSLSHPKGGHSSEDGEYSRLSERTWQWFHPFVGPVAGWWRPARGEELNDALLANRIWEYLIDTHELPFRTDSYDVLYHLMSSRVDDVTSPSRATRLQAIRNFNRGMWLASWYSCVLLPIVLLGDNTLNAGDNVPVLGIEYRSPTYFAHLLSVPHLLAVAVAGVIVFWLIFESTEDDYLEYLFVDYAIAIGNKGADLRLPEGADITLSGEVETQVRSDETDGEDNNGRD